MILFTNGCSWTWGGGLEPWIEEENNRINHEKRLSLVWPHHLGKLLSANQVINLGEGCGSNPRIIRTTFDWLNNQSKDTLKEVIAIIQWSEATRYEYLQSNNEWARCKVDSCMQNTEPEKIALNRIRSRYETYTSVEENYMFLTQCASLAKIFESFKVKYFFWTFGLHCLNDNSDTMHFLNNNFNWIETNNVLMSDERNWQYQRISEKDRHPSIKGHNEIAQILYNKIRDKI